MGELGLRRAGLIDWAITPAVGRGVHLGGLCLEAVARVVYPAQRVAGWVTAYIARTSRAWVAATLELQVAVERGRGPPKGPQSNISSPALMKQVSASAAAYPFLPA